MLKISVIALILGIGSGLLGIMVKYLRIKFDINETECGLFLCLITSLLLCSFLIHPNIFRYPISHCLSNILSGIISVGVYISLIKSISQGRVGPTVSIMNVYTVIQSIESTIFLKHHTPLASYMSMFIIICGAILVFIFEYHDT